jgi:toxin ParE1/3/4
MKSRSLVLTDTAQADLLAIHRHIAQENRPAADRCVHQLHRAMYDLAQNGLAGVSRDHIAKGVRMHPVNSYAVYFRVTEDTLQIVHILHQRQDVTAIFH